MKVESNAPTSQLTLDSFAFLLQWEHVEMSRNTRYCVRKEILRNFNRNSMRCRLFNRKLQTKGKFSLIRPSKSVRLKLCSNWCRFISETFSKDPQAQHLSWLPSLNHHPCPSSCAQRRPLCRAPGLCSFIENEVAFQVDVRQCCVDFQRFGEGLWPKRWQAGRLAMQSTKTLAAQVELLLMSRWVPTRNSSIKVRWC